MGMRTHQLFVAAALLWSGCVASSSSSEEGLTQNGSQLTDCTNCTTKPPPEFTLGGPCAQNSDCDSSPGANDGACYAGVMDISVFPLEGYCTIDDGTGEVCATDEDCGPGNQCADS